MVRKQAPFYEALKIWRGDELKNYMLGLLVDKIAHNGQDGQERTVLGTREIAFENFIESVTTQTHPSEKPQYILPDILFVGVAMGEVVRQQSLVDEAISFVVGDKGMNQNQKMLLKLFVG